MAPRGGRNEHRAKINDDSRRNYRHSGFKISEVNRTAAK